MRTVSVAAYALLGLSYNLWASCGDLFISEYIEGSSYNKAVELYNPTGAPVDLGLYTLELYSNGAGSATQSLTLSGTLAAGDVYVLAHSGADAAILAAADSTNSAVINFNGDDALVLKRSGTVVDAFGEVGFDPGSEWYANSVGTKDETLVRKTDGCGDTDPFDAFDPSSEWESFPKDTFAYLGSYGADGSDDGQSPLTLIHDIQGREMRSPMEGERVTVEAVVTADFRTGGFKGFFVQEEDGDADGNPATSEGLFVYCPSCSSAIAVGDRLRLRGSISEYNGLTEMAYPDVTVLGSGNPLPEPVALTLPVADPADFEAYEGMRVALNAGSAPLVVNENYNLGRYGVFTVASERLFQFTQTHAPDAAGYAAHREETARKSLLVDDGLSYEDPYTILYPAGGLSYDNTLRSGHTIASIPGILDERYGSYRLQPEGGGRLAFTAAANPRNEAPHRGAVADSAIRAASFNVLNYYNTFTACANGADGEPSDCRGADSAEEFMRQRVKIINAMLEVDADIFGLMEIENDGYGPRSALADLVNGLNDAAGETRFAFINVDEKLDTPNALGTDGIKVAMIYDRTRVLPVGVPHAVLLDTDGRNRPSLLQTFKQKRGSKRLTVAVNHFKSKGSACDGIYYDGLEDIDRNDGQGNCSLTRLHAAKRLTGYIASTPPLSRQENVLLLGDFNTYAKGTAVQAIEAAGYLNLENAFLNHPYSYVYDAEAGSLDHAFASEALLRRVEAVHIWHINTDEPRVLDYNLEYKTVSQQSTLYGEGPYRASDHDPVIIDLNL